MVPPPDRHIEVERKFDVTDGAVAPSFAGLSAVARTEQLPSVTLDAQYFDTPRHDLRAHRITLRRRTGGPDEGWHLKLPAGDDTRSELRAPLGDDTDEVPSELRDMVLAIVRDRLLAPVARITTERTVTRLYDADGRLLAEFSDDRVTASPAADGAPEQTWREWEIELAEDAADDTALLDRLGNRLLDAGAEPAASSSKLGRVLTAAGPDVSPRTPSDDPLHRAVAEQVDELLRWDRAVRVDAHDSVHQMRVTTRKIRSLISGAEASFGLTPDAWLLDELRELAAVLGTARDAEVLAERYEAALAALPDELVRGDVRKRLVDGAHRRYRAGLRRSLAAMRSPRYFRLLDALEGLAAAEPHDDGQSATSLAAAYKKLRKRAKAARAAGDHDDEALHRIRKAAKGLRYTASATGATRLADAAKRVQSLLGDHQDAVVSRDHLAREAAAAHAAGEDTFTYGVLYQREDEAARTSRAALGDALKALRKAAEKA